VRQPAGRWSHFPFTYCSNTLSQLFRSTPHPLAFENTPCTELNERHAGIPIMKNLSLGFVVIGSPSFDELIQKQDLNEYKYVLCHFSYHKGEKVKLSL
jgi:hypothetical protein